MLSTVKYPVAGVLLAIAATATLDATGYTNFSALALFPLILIFWFLQKFRRAEIGLAFGHFSDYGVAILYPGVVIGLSIVVVALAGKMDTAGADWPGVFEEMALIAATTVIAALITEEGFFRGALWASFEKSGFDQRRTLLWSSLAFGAWHISFVTLAAGHEMAPGLIPIYIANVTLLGAIWGAMRMASGSVLVPSLSHGVWNGVVYTLYGATGDPGALGVPEGAIWGPETGILGIALNAGFLFFLLRRQRARADA